MRTNNHLSREAAKFWLDELTYSAGLLKPKPDAFTQAWRDHSMLLVGNGMLITRDPNKPFIENGCVCIEGSSIKEVGTDAELRAKYPAAE